MPHRGVDWGAPIQFAALSTALLACSDIVWQVRMRNLERGIRHALQSNTHIPGVPVDLDWQCVFSEGHMHRRPMLAYLPPAPLSLEAAVRRCLAGVSPSPL
jgi:hypothetical protein